MYLAWDNTDGMLGQSGQGNLPGTPAYKREQAAIRAAQSKPKATPRPVVVNDEIIAGARLQWSVMVDSPGVWGELEQTTLNNRVGRLRTEMEMAGFHNVQFAPADYEYTSIAKQYNSRIVVEFTSPMNRRKKADVRYDLEQLARRVGLTPDPNPAHNNVRIIQQGTLPPNYIGGAPAEPGLPTFRPRGDKDADQPDKPFDLGKWLNDNFLLLGLLAVAVVIARR